MKDIAKWVMGVALVTTLVLPKRITPAVFQAGGQAVSSIVGTTMGMSQKG